MNQMKSGIRNGHRADVGKRYRVEQKSHIIGLLQPVHGAISVGEILDHGSGYGALQSGGCPSLIRPALARRPKTETLLPLAAPSPHPRWRPVLQQPVPRSKLDPLLESLHSLMVCPSGASHQVLVHLV